MDLTTKKVDQIMVKNVNVVSMSDSLMAVAQRLTDKKHSCVIVVNDSKPVGIISERDIVGVVSGSGECERLDAGSVMSSPVHCVPSDATLEEAIRFMQQKRFRRFPVITGDGMLAGLVTQSDVIKAVAKMQRKQVEELERVVEEKTRELTRLSVTDELTGLYNRRYLDKKLADEFERTRRYGVPLLCGLLDIDNFKEINDTYGHDCGDKILAALARLVASNIRKVDTCARYGGDELFLILPHTPLSSAEVVGEKIRKVIEGHRFAYGDHTISTTISMGFSYAPSPDIRNHNDLIREADRMLYQAKAGGRNKVEIHSHPVSPDGPDASEGVIMMEKPPA